MNTHEYAWIRMNSYEYVWMHANNIYINANIKHFIQTWIINVVLFGTGTFYDARYHRVIILKNNIHMLFPYFFFNFFSVLLNTAFYDCTKLINILKNNGNTWDISKGRNYVFHSLLWKSSI